MAAKQLVLRFSAESGNARNITLNNVNHENIDGSDIAIAMDEMLATETLIISKTGEVLTTKVSAKYVTQVKTEVSVK